MSSEENKALLAELKETKASATDASVSEVAAKMQQTKTELVKTRDIKKFVKHKSAKAIANDEQVSIQERRSYRLDNISDNLSADVLYTTYAYYHDPAKRVFLSVEKMRELRNEYLQKLAVLAHFQIQNVYKYFDITGSNRSDTARNDFKSVSLYCSKDDVADATKLEAIVAKARELKKQCIYYNISESDRRKVYEFVKV